jgi:hypothetical protein
MPKLCMNSLIFHTCTFLTSVFFLHLIITESAYSSIMLCLYKFIASCSCHIWWLLWKFLHLPIPTFFSMTVPSSHKISTTAAQTTLNAMFCNHH